MIVNPEIKKLIPADLLELAEKSGVKRISTSSWLYAIRRLFGFFDPENKEILIDLTRENKLLILYRKRYPELNLVGPDVFIFLLLHEIGHSLYGEGELRAEEYAKKKFTEWRSEQRKKIVKAVQEALEEGFKARAV